MHWDFSEGKVLAEGDLFTADQDLVVHLNPLVLSQSPGVISIIPRCYLNPQVLSQPPGAISIPRCNPNPQV